MPEIYGETTVESDPYTGAFAKKGNKKPGAPSGADYTCAILTFAASRCSNIYGSSDTVRPESYPCLYYIKF